MCRVSDSSPEPMETIIVEDTVYCRAGNKPHIAAK